MSKPLLYTYWRSSCSWRVRAGKVSSRLHDLIKFHWPSSALYLKGIDFDMEAVNLVDRAQVIR